MVVDDDDGGGDGDDEDDGEGEAKVRDRAGEDAGDEASLDADEEVGDVQPGGGVDEGTVCGILARYKTIIPWARDMTWIMAPIGSDIRLFPPNALIAGYENVDHMSIAEKVNNAPRSSSRKLRS